MKRDLAVFAGLFAIGVAAVGVTSCEQAAVVATETVLPAADVQKLQQTCVAAQPLLAAATAPTAPASVSGIATYGAAYCQQLTAGAVPATTTPTTPSWLSGVLNAVQLAAQVAGMVMPLVALF